MKETVRPTPGGKLGNPRDWTPKLHATRKHNKMPAKDPASSQDIPEPPFLKESPIADDWMNKMHQAVDSSLEDQISKALFAENEFDVSFASPAKRASDSSSAE